MKIDWDDRYIQLGAGVIGLILLMIAVLVIRKICCRSNRDLLLDHSSTISKITNRTALSRLSDVIHIRVHGRDGEVSFDQIGKKPTEHELKMKDDKVRGERVSNADIYFPDEEHPVNA